MNDNIKKPSEWTADEVMAMFASPWDQPVRTSDDDVIVATDPDDWEWDN